MAWRKFCSTIACLLAGVAAGQDLPAEDLANSLFADFWDSEREVLPSVASGQELILGQRYRAFLQEGQKLKDYCLNSPPITYARAWEYEQALRSVLATLQYLGLDLTTTALVRYAHYFDFSEEEFANLAHHFVGGRCSPNLTVVGKKQLEKTLLQKFALPPDQKFPRLVGTEERTARRQEFLATVNLFTAFCSWGLDTYDLRLLGPLVSNGAIMAYVFRNLQGQKLTWDFQQQTAYLTKHPKAVQIGCEQLICRRQDKQHFLKTFPRAIGTTSLKDDLQRLYCVNLVHQKFPAKHPLQAVQAVLEQGVLAGYLMSAQFLSLLTEEGDRHLQQAVGQDQDMGKYIFSLSEELWRAWAKRELNKQANNFAFEESFVIEGRPREAYFNPEVAQLRVEFSFNYGEFDRAVEHLGKLGVEQKFKLPASYLEWAARSWRNIDPTNNEERAKIRKNMEEQVRLAWKKVEQEYAFFALTDDLRAYVAQELLAQLGAYRGKPLETVWRDTFVPITIKFYVAPFALKALAQQYRDRQLDWSKIPFQRPLYLGSEHRTEEKPALAQEEVAQTPEAATW